MSEMTRKEEIPHISKRIKQLRKAKGWTQPELAKHAKVTDGAVKMWETGKRFPRGANLRNLASALGVSESDILDDQAPAPKPVQADRDKNALILRIQSRLTALDENELRFVDGFIEDLEARASSTPTKSTVAK